MSGFKPYPAYKDSEVTWMGEIPEHWLAKGLKRIFKIEGGSTPTPDEVNWDGDIAWVTPADLSGLKSLDVDSSKRTITATGLASCATTLLPEGSLILSTRAPIGSLAITLIRMCTNQGCKGLVPNPGTSSRYFAYVLLSTKDELNNRGKGTTFLEISGDELGRFSVPMPPAHEQTQIAHFLNHETARIDALIAEQQCLIELLKEKRQAVISHAVTKGLDPTVPMKDSGVEWLGEVPAHWRVSKLGHYAQILTGFPFPSASFSHDESDVRLLRGANIGVGSLKWMDTVYWNLGEGDNLSSYLMEEGQIVLGMDRPWIGGGMRIARVTQEDMPCLLLQRVAAISPNAELDDEYLFCLLASELFKTYVEPDLTGVSVPHISPEQIMSFQISVPQIGEQRRIRSFIRNQLDQMSALFEQASESVELLQERRSALISAAVTGKIDVRGWQPPAPVQTPELEEAEAV